MHPYTEHLLALAKPLREGVCRVRPSSEGYEAAKALKDAIDTFAEAATGDREYFWTKPHSIASGPNADRTPG